MFHLETQKQSFPIIIIIVILIITGALKTFIQNFFKRFFRKNAHEVSQIPQLPKSDKIVTNFPQKCAGLKRRQVDYFDCDTFLMAHSWPRFHRFCPLIQHLPTKVVVAQLVERSLPTPEVHSSTPVIGKIYIEHLFSCLLSTVLKRQNKIKEAGNSPLLIQHLTYPRWSRQCPHILLREIQTFGPLMCETNALPTNVS